ncbi:hypothetical protein CBM2589_B200067 [Cupriavidus taiwanensis]|uniref:Uncharacterized protein n=1 Tax=Cupriavidus taiwanensis TaxID=164546 RepID=A0A375BM10_9BURK|nr:hypothetical protein CBM2589_B200067 [Cupriavidus taiwanensis]
MLRRISSPRRRSTCSTPPPRRSCTRCWAWNRRCSTDLATGPQKKPPRGGFFLAQSRNRRYNAASLFCAHHPEAGIRPSGSHARQQASLPCTRDKN